MFPIIYTSPISPSDVPGYLETLSERLKGFLPTFIFALIIFFIGYIIAKIIISIVGKGLKKSRLDESAHGFIKTLIQIMLYVLISVIAFSTLGADLSSIVAVIGAAGLAIGLSLQNSLANVAGGFIILFTKPFKKGDFIETCGVSGTVYEISILSTTFITTDNKVIRIPNGTLSSSTTVNCTEKDRRRLDIDFKIKNEHDHKKAIEIIENIVKENPLVLKDGEIFVRITELTPGITTITSKVWVKTDDYYDLKSDILESVKSEFDKVFD